MATESNNPAMAHVPAPVVAQIPTPVVTPVVPVVHHGEKPEKFNGLNFKMWQQKMLFYLTTLNLARFLTEEAPKANDNEQDFQVITAVDAWKQSDYLCRNYVMNGLTDSLYEVYRNKNGKEIMGVA